MRKCTTCGNTEIKAGDRFCTICGRKLIELEFKYLEDRKREAEFHIQVWKQKLKNEEETLKAINNLLEVIK